MNTNATPAGGQATPAYVTVITADRPCQKTFSVDSNGKIIKAAAPPITSGIANVVRVDAADDLARLLESLNERQAVVPGIIVDGQQAAPLTTKARRHEQPGAICRSPDFLGYGDGAPAWAMLDFDISSWPDALRQRVQGAGGLRRVLATACPGLDGAAMVLRASQSSGIVNSVSGERTGHSGAHVWVKVADGADASRFARTIHRRLLTAGFGHAFVSAAGIAFARSILDVSASGDGSRIVYEALAALADPRLTHDPSIRRPIVQAGVALDTRVAAPDLSADYVAAFHAAERAILDGAADETAAARRAWEAKQGTRYREHGRDSRGWPIIEIDGDQTLSLDDGRTVSVLDVLASPTQYGGQTLADVLEPSYGGGRNKAVIAAGPSGVAILSMAHGGARYVPRPTSEQIAHYLMETPNGS